jgi:hypothetical protein
MDLQPPRWPHEPGTGSSPPSRSVVTTPALPPGGGRPFSAGASAADIPFPSTRSRKLARSSTAVSTVRPTGSLHPQTRVRSGNAGGLDQGASSFRPVSGRDRSRSECGPATWQCRSGYGSGLYHATALGCIERPARWGAGDRSGWHGAGGSSAGSARRRVPATLGIEERVRCPIGMAPAPRCRRTGRWC